jgi:hypothetical protein
LADEEPKMENADPSKIKLCQLLDS